MRLTATTYSHLWATTLTDALASLGELGFATVELMASPPHVSLGSDDEVWVREASRALDRGGPEVVSVNPPGLDLNLASPDGRVRQESLRQYARAIRGAGRLGSRFVVVVPGRRSPLLPCPDDMASGWLREALSELADVAASSGVRLVLETTPSGFLDRGHELRDFVESSAKGDSAGLCYDVANGFMIEDPEQTLVSLGASVEMVHVSDTTRQRWSHSGIGAGEIDWTALAWLSRQDSFPVVLETIHPSRPSEGILADLEALRSFDWEV